MLFNSISFLLFFPIILGSSRVYKGVNPEIIKKISGKKTEVIASTGMILNFVEPHISDYLLHNKVPETVVIQVDASLSSEYFFKRAYLPASIFQFPSYPENSSILNGEFAYHKNKLRDINRFNISRYFRSYSFFYYHFDYYMMLFVQSDYEHIAGFQPCDCKWEPEYNKFINKINYGTVDYDTLITKQILKRTIENVKKKGVKNIIITDIPYYDNMIRYVVNFSQWRKFLWKFSRAEKIPFIEFNNGKYQLAKDTANFYNPGHLNLHGANKFSEDFADSIVSKIQKNGKE